MTLGGPMVIVMALVLLTPIMSGMFADIVRR